MLIEDSEIVICPRFVNCELWSCDMNSTLGSVVPLAMFILLLVRQHSILHISWKNQRCFVPHFTFSGSRSQQSTDYDWGRARLRNCRKFYIIEGFKIKTDILRSGYRGRHQNNNGFTTVRLTVSSDPPNPSSFYDRLFVILVVCLTPDNEHVFWNGFYTRKRQFSSNY